MQRKTKSLDGFIKPSDKTPDKAPAPVLQRRKAPQQSQLASPVDRRAAILKKDLTDSLDDIDKPKHSKSVDFKDLQKKPSRIQRKLDKKNQKRAKKGKKPLTLNRFRVGRIIRRAILVIIIVVFAVGGYLVYRGVDVACQVFDCSKFSLIDMITTPFSQAKLKTDKSGRTNFLVFGTEAEDHDGGDLTDSVMIISIDQENYDAYAVSLPRDLWVSYPEVCSYGYQGKLNATYICGVENNSTNPDGGERAGQEALATVATRVTGIDIHYYVHVNFQVAVSAIDALGGVDILVEAYDGSPIVEDYGAERRYESGKVYHMDGYESLIFSRLRGAYGGTGLSGGNFDRELNQQKVIKAALEKFNSSDSFNINTINDLMLSVGANLNTNVAPTEIQSLVYIAKNFNQDNLVSIPLVDSENSIYLMTTGMIGEASVVLPVAGQFDYSAIKAHIKQAILGGSNSAVSESALIDIYNGSGITGLAGQQADILRNSGFTIGETNTAPNPGTYSTVEIYQLSAGFSRTVKSLEERYQTTAKQAVPSGISSSADFVVIFGGTPPQS